MIDIPRENFNIGRCIYCGSTTEPLSREHIVPYGLNGEWVLQKASCSECADITSKFERSILRGLLPQARAALKFQTRSTHPETFPIVIEVNGQKKTINLIPEDYGAVVLLPLFKMPAFLEKREPIQGTLDVIGMAMQRITGTDITELHKRYGAQKIDFSFAINFDHFLRLLAKIAYGYAVLNYGLDGFNEIYALPIIMGETDEVDKWIGSEHSTIGDEEVSIKLSKVGNDLVAKIRLFGKRQVPTYVVVIGSLK